MFPIPQRRETFRLKRASSKCRVRPAVDDAERLTDLVLNGEVTGHATDLDFVDMEAERGVEVLVERKYGLRMIVHGRRIYSCLLGCLPMAAEHNHRP